MTNPRWTTFDGWSRVRERPHDQPPSGSLPPTVKPRGRRTGPAPPRRPSRIVSRPGTAARTIVSPTTATPTVTNRLTDPQHRDTHRHESSHRPATPRHQRHESPRGGRGGRARRRRGRRRSDVSVRANRAGGRTEPLPRESRAANPGGFAAWSRVPIRRPARVGCPRASGPAGAPGARPESVTNRLTDPPPPTPTVTNRLTDPPPPTPTVTNRLTDPPHRDTHRHESSQGEVRDSVWPGETNRDGRRKVKRR